ncbi:MAG TPA: L-rhamnose isomerase [Mycobacteriales bacterium]|jgi:L-rhamnose isomerase/sugar isomerase|nr:L-rhamnose isomerase [Mycobacteriales bacterium]
MGSSSAVKAALKQQRIETPSWAYGNSGTRFKVFAQPGVPRTPYEKIADAAQVHAFTGVAPSVAIHIPWDAVQDYADLSRQAQELGVRIGAINPNTFQDDDYKFGSVCHPDAAVRRKATDHLLECIEIGKQTGSDILSIWLADGTNYAGQDSMRDRQERLHETLSETYAALPAGMRMLLEYKFFEPAFYHTDVCDWGTSYSHCLRLGDQAQVLIDTGHHAPGTNIEYIVALLLGQRKLGGFHFNSRNFADDDLIVGTADPFELFLIMNEIVDAGDLSADVAFMLDQCHNLEPKITAEIRSIMNVQEATAKALLVDREALKAAQRAGDVLEAHGALMDAFNTDVRPLLAEVRDEMGIDPEPVKAFKRSGYLEKVAEQRVGGSAMGWGA